jgi:hypothetical protein
MQYLALIRCSMPALPHERSAAKYKNVSGCGPRMQPFRGKAINSRWSARGHRVEGTHGLFQKRQIPKTADKGTRA